MSIITQKKDELEDYTTARLVTGALRDISALRLQSFRKEFERGREYYNEIENLYRLVKSYAIEKNLSVSRVEERNKNPRVLSVAITSNKRFYGNLNNNVMREFEERMNSEPSEDFLIVGSTGRQYLKNTKHTAKNKFFEFKEDTPDPNEIVVFIDTTRQYDHVIIFYPQFKSVFKQDITAQDITYVPETTKKITQDIQYLFEPELQDIFWFFETQVRYILFNQVMLEVELARTSARLLKMDTAEQGAVEALKNADLSIQKLIASFNSRRLLESFSGFFQWGKKNSSL